MPKRFKRASRYFLVGERIEASGIYRVFHSGHRISHEVTLLSGETFPRCAVCGNDVCFELLAQARKSLLDLDFRVRLYEIPHPKVEEEENAKKIG